MSSGTTANHKPRFVRPGSTKTTTDSQDDLLRKFSTSFKKAMESRTKSVKFNTETVDVSIGGTQSHGMIKMDVSTDVSMLSTSSASTSSEDTSSSFNNTVIEKKPKAASVQQGVAPTSSVPRISVQSSVPRHLSENGNTRVGTPTRKSDVSGGFKANTPLGHNTHSAPVQTPECYQPVVFATPLPPNLKHRLSSSIAEMDTSMERDGSSVTVAVRVRPFNTKEIAKCGTKCVVSMVANETTVTSESGVISRFTYDYSFWSFDKVGGVFADQEHVYNTLAQPMLGHAFEGYNVCLFAYGQTGSGKSYSIMGHGQEEPGVIPRFCEELFGRIENKHESNVTSNVEISFFEIYNEKIHDLLALSTASRIIPGKRLNLKVREDPVLGPFVEGLSKYLVRSFADIQGWLNVGNKHRATAATGMNEKSSRSHSVFTIVLTQTRARDQKARRPFVGIVPGLVNVYKEMLKIATDEIEGEEHEHSVTSKINLVDLAGSERQSHAKTSGDRLREGASINKSLHTLGKVISLLSERSHSSYKKKKVFIPYRDSVLTWLLKESLGGNSKTAMLATVGPSDTYIEETLSTLRYASQARSIINMAKVNEDANARLIRELREEIDKLRSQTSSGLTSNDGLIGASLAEIATLKDKLSEKEREMVEMTRSWQERLAQSEERKLEEARLLELSGISFKVDNKRPSLVNLNEDPQLSETLLYILKDGLTRIGQQAPGTSHDIQLHGPLIAENHCGINNVGSVVTINPTKDALTYVNGNQITKPTVLHHGDRVILGGDHYFRFSHPSEALKGRKSAESGVPKGANLKDFEFAKQELIRVQNDRLQAELETAKRRHLEEMEKKLEKERSVAQQQLALEMERKKREADQELKRQRHQYEERLAELERMLQEQKQEHLETEHDRQAAQGRIERLEKEKHLLETEVRTKMERLKEEALKSQKIMAESRQQHSRLVVQLEQEQQKIQKDVEQIRMRRGATPNTPRLTPARTPVTENARTDLYRQTLLLREANKISQCFKKDVVYSREEVRQGEDMQTLIKVTNTKLGISTFWPMRKFEARLLHMRELFQSCDPDLNSGEADEVFNDMNDTWERADRGISPKVLQSLKKSAGRGSNSCMSFSSVSSVDSLDSDLKFPSLNMENPDQSTIQEGPSVISMCRDLISTALNRFTEVALQESVVDKILCHCEVLKHAITSMLESFNLASESPLTKGEFLGSTVMQVSSIQLASHMEIVLTQCTLWVGSYETLTSGLVRDLCTHIMSTARKLGTQLVLFLQGCENDIDTLVQESAGQSLSSLFTLSKHCGELALATETAMVCLTDTRGSMGGEEEDEEQTKIKVSHDIRQSFLSGCDLFIDKTLEGGLRTVQEQMSSVQALADDSENMTESMEEFVCQAAVVTGHGKDMLKKCRQMQSDLDLTLRDSLTESKPEWYYSRSFRRSQSLVSHISNLTETVTHLVQATRSYTKGTDATALRKVCRMCELLQKSTSKLLSSSNIDPVANSSFNESASNTSDTSVLSESRREELEAAACEVKMSADSLISLTKKHEATGCVQTMEAPSRSKRLLPSSPVTGSGVTRRDSLKEASSHRKVQALKRAFENTS